MLKLILARRSNFISRDSHKRIRGCFYLKKSCPGSPMNRMLDRGEVYSRKSRKKKKFKLKNFKLIVTICFLVAANSFLFSKNYTSFNSYPFTW